MKIEIKGLTKKYGNVTALDGINLVLENGIYGILGPNGAGKSTMINLLTDNVKRDEGEILCEGEEILSMGSRFRQLIGYMPQQQNMYDGYSAMAFLKYIASIKGIPSGQAAEEIEHLLKVVNLWEARYRKVGGFSGGMKQRVLLAQALLGNLKLLILDEPTAGLDPNERIKIRNYIAELGRDRIVLFATHVVSDIECIADNIIMIKGGKIVGLGTTTEIIESVENKVAQIYCDSSQLTGLQQKYKAGNVNRTKSGLVLRIVGDDLPKEAVNVGENVGLEDVYLYYLA